MPNLGTIHNQLPTCIPQPTPPPRHKINPKPGKDEQIQRHSLASTKLDKQSHMPLVRTAKICCKFKYLIFEGSVKKERTSHVKWVPWLQWDIYTKQRTDQLGPWDDLCYCFWTRVHVWELVSPDRIRRLRIVRREQCSSGNSPLFAPNISQTIFDNDNLAREWMQKINLFKKKIDYIKISFP